MDDTPHLGQGAICTKPGRLGTANPLPERAFNPRWPRVRRFVFFSLVGLSTVTAATFMAAILIANGLAWIELAILVLFTTNFLLIALSFWSPTAGFVVQALGLDPISLRRRRPTNTSMVLESRSKSWS